MITWFEADHTGTCLGHDPGYLVTDDRRNSRAECTIDLVDVRVAKPTRNNVDENLSATRTIDLHLVDHDSANFGHHRRTHSGSSLVAKVPVPN
jgi:hypothetical protein